MSGGNFSTQRVMRYWHRFPRVVDAPPGGFHSQVGWDPKQPDLVLNLVDGNSRG